MATRTPLHDERATEATDALAATEEEIGIPIEGRTGASCVRHVERALEKVPGVRSVSVNLATERAAVAANVDTKRVNVVYDAAVASPAVISAALAGAGYPAAE